MSDDTLRHVQEMLGSPGSVRLAVTDDEVFVRLRVHHIPADERGGIIHTTYSEWKPLGQPFSLDTQSFGQVLQVALRYGTPDA